MIQQNIPQPPCRRGRRVLTFMLKSIISNGHHNRKKSCKIYIPFKKIRFFIDNIEEMAQKICGYLDQQNPANKELCQEPLNNDSWKYSVSQALKTQTKEQEVRYVV